VADKPKLKDVGHGRIAPKDAGCRSGTPGYAPTPLWLSFINDQTVVDEVVNPFGGMKASGAGSRVGGPLANFGAFTELQWVTVQSEPPTYPF